MVHYCRTKRCAPTMAIANLLICLCYFPVTRRVFYALILRLMAKTNMLFCLGNDQNATSCTFRSALFTATSIPGKLVLLFVSRWLDDDHFTSATNSTKCHTLSYQGQKSNVETLAIRLISHRRQPQSVFDLTKLPRPLQPFHSDILLL